MRCGARLTTDRLSFGQRFVDLDDITGCLCMKAPPPASGAADSSATASAAYLTVYAYSLVKTGPITFFYRFEEGSEIVHSFHCTRAIVYLTTTPLHFFVWFFFPNLTHLHSFQRRCSSLIVLLLVFCFLFFLTDFHDGLLVSSFFLFPRAADQQPRGACSGGAKSCCCAATGRRRSPTTGAASTSGAGRSCAPPARPTSTIRPKSVSLFSVIGDVLFRSLLFVRVRHFYSLLAFFVVTLDKALS